MLGGEFNKEKDIYVDKIKSIWDQTTSNPLKKALLFFFPVIFSLAFALFFTNEFGNLVAFMTLMLSLWFIIVSIWMLVWILKKDCGTEQMIEIADTIKEGA